MGDKTDPNFLNRKYLHAKRPSEKVQQKERPQKNTDNDNQGIKRKYASGECYYTNKKQKNEDSLTEVSPKSVKNSANERLKRLRKNLAENLQKQPDNQNKINLINKQNSAYKLKSDTKDNSPSPVIQRSATCKNFNFSLPSCSFDGPSRQEKKYTSDIFSKTAPNLNTSQTNHSVSSFKSSTPLKSENEFRSPLLNRSKSNKSQNEEHFKSKDNISLEENSLRDSFNRVIQNSFNESMDWAPVTEESVLENINEIRKEINYKDQAVSVLVNHDISKNTNILSTISYVYIVVDTNVFLSHLKFIRELKNQPSTDRGQPVIVVPWMVMQELDYMKDGRSHRSLKDNSRRAINFIHECISNKDPHLQGQNVLEASKQDIQSNNPDDGILFCCLQLQQKGRNVILLSNDKNFRSKAMISDIESYSKDEIMTKLNCATKTHSIGNIDMILSQCLSIIVEAEMMDAYGDVWSKMAKVVSPLTLEEGLYCIEKYWVAVFSFKMLKQAKQCIDEFCEFMKTIKNRSSLNEEKFTKFVEFSLRLCIYLKNAYNEHKTLIAETIGFVQRSASENR